MGEKIYLHISRSLEEQQKAATKTDLGYNVAVDVSPNMGRPHGVILGYHTVTNSAKPVYPSGDNILNVRDANKVVLFGQDGKWSLDDINKQMDQKKMSPAERTEVMRIYNAFTKPKQESRLNLSMNA